MDLAERISDNISELLVKIVEFTKVRHNVLMDNLKNISVTSYMPKELAVDEFADAMNNAIVEHIQNKRLVLRDTESIQYGTNGSFEIRPIKDLYAKELLDSSADEYMELQITKLSENAINQKLAMELLKEKESLIISSDHEVS